MKLSRLFSSLLPPPAPWGRTLFAVTLATLATTWAVQSATPAVAQLPVVSLDATVEFTSEPAPNIRVQPGVFTIKRSGDLSHDLTVFLKYEGSATPDVDYVKLPDTLTIPAGQASAELLVTALEDSLAEGIETVAAWLVDPPVDRVPDQVIDPAHNVAKII